MKLYTLEGNFIEENGFKPPNFTGIIEKPDGKLWFKDGILHREDGPAVEYPCGRKEWCTKGKRNRIGGPAIIWPDGSKQWRFEGKLHRIDGPAFERPVGYKYWYLNDKQVTEEQHKLFADLLKLKGLL